MGDSAFKELIELDLFNSLDKEIVQNLCSDVELLEFSIGQVIIEKDIIPGKVLIVKEGEARLIGEIDDQITTLGKFGPGSILGLASILSGRCCENFISTGTLKAYSIDEKVILEQYNNEIKFSDWCDRRLLPQEVIYLVRVLTIKSARGSENFINNLNNSLNLALLVTPNNEAIKNALDDSREIFNCSNWFNSSNNCNSIKSIETKQDKSSIHPRLISLPIDLVKVIRNQPDSSTIIDIKKPQDSSTKKTDSSYIRQSKSKFNTGSEIIDRLELITVEGDIPQIVATYKMLSKLMNLPLRRDSIERIVEDIVNQRKKPSLQDYGQIAASLGLHVIKARVSALEASRLQFPSLIEWRGVLSIVVKSDKDGLLIASPAYGLVQVDGNKINESFEGGIEYLILERMRTTPVDRFGPDWFVPAIKRYKNVLFQVVIASFVVQLFTLANPLIIQVIIDKVISQRSLDTLQVLGIALLVLTLVEGVLASLKTFLFVETTNRIDQKLGSEVIDHLLRLPLEYFDRRPVGELGTRIGELEKIRNFITGRGLTTILDAGYSIIYIGVMILYSTYLTIIALIVLPIQIGITILGAPLFRKQFRESAEDNAKTQSHLIEVITGIQTVKAQNVETTSRWKWQELYSKYITSTFKKTITGTAINQTSQVLQKISQLLVLWVGASMVLEGKLTLGQLIAFRIISGYVTQPILRLTTIWQNIQELRVSFERLGDVINTNTESDVNDQGKISLPPVKGDVTFENLDFKFQYSNNLILNNINFKISKATFVGIVGKSGSGKSTLMKLVSRLYSPQKGKILIDGYDIDKVELYSLRRQIGIVPQDPLLFAGTITENITGNNDEGSQEDIVKAAKLAAAHDFIMQMSSGYSTQIGERGASMSGGQRQRIAIARTLFTKPKILIFDEATSALDFETERKVVENLAENYKQATIFFITHRLSTVSKADTIIMMEEGSISEIGSYRELMQRKGSFYSLYNKQETE